jgi:hypothetical protein
MPPLQESRHRKGGGSTAHLDHDVARTGVHAQQLAPLEEPENLIVESRIGEKIELAEMALVLTLIECEFIGLLSGQMIISGIVLPTNEI